MTGQTSLDIVGLSVGLLGGLAIFLYGLDKLTDGLKVVAGDRMRNLLARMTNNRFKAVTAGAMITAVIQSSSVTTVLVVGFISAGLISLSQSIGVIMGASIGTTITAQIIAFKVTKFSLVLVALGFAMQFISRREQVKQYGHMLLGLGLVFFGMELMKQAMSPLQAYEPFAETMKTLDNPLLAGSVRCPVYRLDPELIRDHGSDHRPGERRLPDPGDRYPNDFRSQHRHLRNGRPRIDRQTARGGPRGHGPRSF